MSDYVIMYGPDFDNPSKTVRTKVHRDNINAFRASGWTVAEDAAGQPIDVSQIPDYYASVSKKKEREKAREPLTTSPQTLNTEPLEAPEDNETPKEADPKEVKKDLNKK
jgi:hypothetical protein